MKVALPVSDATERALARIDALTVEEQQLKVSKQLLAAHVADLDEDELAIAKRFNLITVLNSVIRRRD
jgi:hypothetical protein